MGKPTKIEVNGKDYDLSDTDVLNVREKATVPEIPLPEPVLDFMKMNGIQGYAMGIKAVCDSIDRFIERCKDIRIYTPVMEIENLIACLERIKQENGADNIKV